MTLSVVDTLLVLLALVLIVTLIYNPLSDPHAEMAWIQADHHDTEQQDSHQNGVNRSGSQWALRMRESRPINAGIASRDSPSLCPCALKSNANRFFNSLILSNGMAVELKSNGNTSPNWFLTDEVILILWNGTIAAESSVLARLNQTRKHSLTISFLNVTGAALKPKRDTFFNTLLDMWWVFNREIFLSMRSSIKQENSFATWFLSSIMLNGTLIFSLDTIILAMVIIITFITTVVVMRVAVLFSVNR